MKHASTFKPYRAPLNSTQRAARNTKGAADFLRTDTSMAALLPALARMSALQRVCAASLPAMFNTCEILQFESGQMVLSTPNAALAARLKQQLPRLQDRLQKDGWQVNSIRIKVQVTRITPPEPPRRGLDLPKTAVSSFAELSELLEDSPRNQALKLAIDSMVRRRRSQP